MRRIALLVLPLITLFPLSASALTIRDVVELTRAGLGEDVILALIEVDPSVFPIDTATLKMLKAAGVSQRVIVAMVRSGRTQPSLPIESPVPIVEEGRAPEPQVVVIDHHEPPQVREVQVAVPIYVPVAADNRRRHVSDHVSNVPDPVDAAHRQWVRGDALRDEPARPSPPVYWGFGGHLRPDAWQPTPVKKDRDR